MNWLKLINSRQQMYADVVEEIQLHLEEKIEGYVAEGLSRTEAESRARHEFGDTSVFEELCREAWQWRGIESTWADLKSTVRQAWDSPVLTAATFLVLAIGIGANTVIFSLVNAVLRNPTGVDRPRQIAVLHTRYGRLGVDIPRISVPDFATTLSLGDEVEAGALEKTSSFNMQSGIGSTNVIAASVSAQWFKVFGANPLLGHTFTIGEEQPNSDTVAILSYALWQQTFGGSTDVVGSTITLDDRSYRIVGVMRNDFAWPRTAALWIPLRLSPAAFDTQQFFNESYLAVVRLRPRVSIQRFQDDLGTTLRENLRRLRTTDFAAKSDWSVYATSFTSFAAGPLQKPLYVLMAVVLVVSLIASANVACLFLVRTPRKSRELATRMMLGTGAMRTARPLFIEALLLTGCASIVALVLCPFAETGLLAALPHKLGNGFEARTDISVVAMTVGVALLTAFLAAAGPDLIMTRRGSDEQLHGMERRSASPGTEQNFLSAFVIGEAALAFLLLSGTGLFLTNLRSLRDVDPGFNASGILQGQVSFSGNDIKTDPVRQHRFINSVVRSLASQPGVLSAAAVDPLPFADVPKSCSFSIGNELDRFRGLVTHSQVTFATPRYLRVMNIHLLAGRWFSAEDVANTERVAVIDSSLAKQYWPRGDALGQHITFGCSQNQATIVGIIEAVRNTSLEEGPTEGMRYYPLAQASGATVTFLIRASRDAGRMAETLKYAVAATDSSQTVISSSPMKSLVADSLADRRLIVWMLAGFAGIALLLVAVGISGLVSYLAQQPCDASVPILHDARHAESVALAIKSSFLRVIVGILAGIFLSLGATIALHRFYTGFGVGMVCSLGAATFALCVTGLLATRFPMPGVGGTNPSKC